MNKTPETDTHDLASTYPSPTIEEMVAQFTTGRFKAYADEASAFSGHCGVPSVELSEFKKFNELKPHQLPDIKPSPLKNTLNEFHTVESGITALNDINKLVAMGNFYSDVSEQACTDAALELFAQQEWRSDQNSRSRDRLDGAMERRPPSSDMLSILRKAETGSAKFDELFMLLHNYPEMISVEYYKFVKPFDSQSRSNALRFLMMSLEGCAERREELAITEIDTRKKMLETTYSGKAGILVRKMLLGAMHKDNTPPIEVVVKTTDLVIGSKDDESHLPLSITAYMRVSNYKDYVGYTSGEAAQRSMMEIDEEARSRLGAAAYFTANKST